MRGEETTDETAEQREKRKEMINETCEWAKMEFAETINALKEETDDRIDKLPVLSREQAAKSIIHVIRVITGFFKKAFSAIVQEIKKFYQTCKETLEKITAYMDAAIKLIYGIFQHQQGKKPTHT